jgi:ATPase family associated with various cellular activities (AAA)
VDEQLSEFGKIFARYIQRALDAAPDTEPDFAVLIREHLGTGPADLPILSEEVHAWDQVNLQLGLEALFARGGRSVKLVGIGGTHSRHMSLALSDLLSESHVRPASVEYVNLAVGPGRSHACMTRGVALLTTPEGPAVIYVSPAEQQRPGANDLGVELMTPVEALAPKLLAELRELMREHNVFRGQMVSLESTIWGSVEVVFHERPSLAREAVILSEPVVLAIERHVLLIGERADVLVAAGRHLKRGLLLYGPPGTGKTHTVRWITSELPSSTVIVLSGGSLGAVGPVCRLARELAPSLLVLEDVDLVARERTMSAHGGSLLFELLNELDGMADDADVAVVLTTNRPELLEPALAARPGRVDLAVEIPLPDVNCRRRLFELYARGLTLELDDRDVVIARTEGVTASFFRELLRQAVLEAAEQDSGIVRDAHLTAALERLLSMTNEMTRVLLGATPYRSTTGFRAPDDAFSA